MAHYDRRRCADGQAHVPGPTTGDDDQRRAACQRCDKDIVSNWYDDDDRAVGYGAWMTASRPG